MKTKSAPATTLKNFKWAEILIILALATALAIIAVANIKDNQEKDRDAVRISNISDIRSALNDYYERNNTFPVCLYAMHGCASLEGSNSMEVVPRDPLMGIEYTYASIGQGSWCQTYHLGASLERTTSQALLTGSDAPPVSAEELCEGSAPDFSGLSYAPGGEPCNAMPGIAQPTSEKNSETCYEIKPRPR